MRQAVWPGPVLNKTLVLIYLDSFLAPVCGTVACTCTCIVRRSVMVQVLALVSPLRLGYGALNT